MAGRSGMLGHFSFIQMGEGIWWYSDNLLSLPALRRIGAMFINKFYCADFFVELAG